jgi:hypothetical protein
MARETVDNQDQVVRAPEDESVRPLVNGSGAPVEPMPPDNSAVGADAAGFVSPQQFYRQATQRDDIRRILDALAK